MKTRTTLALAGLVLTVPLATTALAGDDRGCLSSRICVGANLVGDDMSGMDMRGMNFRNADMRGANMSGADMRGADMRGADMRGAYMRGANLGKANMAKANLKAADLRNVIGKGAILTRASLVATDLRGANFKGVQGAHADFSMARLGQFKAFSATEKRENTHYDNGTYNGTSFAWGNLPNSTWQSSSISNADFSRANIYQSSFFGATWGGTNTFWQTCINDVDWRYVGSVPYSGPTRGRPCNSVDTWD